MEYKIRKLTNKDYPQWYNFISRVYGKQHILKDWAFLKWYYGGIPDYRLNEYETIISVLPNGKIIGSYGVLPAFLRVLDKKYSFCWYVSVIIDKQYRNQGIGRNFVRTLLNTFDVCGGLGFNLKVKGLYKREGFKFFKNKTMRRFIMILRPEAFELVEKIGFNPEEAKNFIPISENIPNCFSKDIHALNIFNEGVNDCFRDMVLKIKVNIIKSAEYLNWRFFFNPRINYDCIAKKRGGKWLAYLVARHERYYPTKIYSTRILDVAGSPDYAKSLLEAIIINAFKRGDSLIENYFFGNYYEEIMNELEFIELKNTQYVWLPLVTSPIECRDNHEFIFLGSHKYPKLFENINHSDLYFTRGDSDRDRANIIIE